MSISRSVSRGAMAMTKGIESIKEEISFWESLTRRTKSVKKRLERLYAVKVQLMENPKESQDLIDSLFRNKDLIKRLKEIS